ncbi:helix-turn-helix domain-containing protein [Aeromonas veronii]|uniref:helix-turn-helix domain-containing protein n=1 Tax=Aeromonas veronii TaxID=654 RepID=UPI0011162581|nr:helix-turn-helix transcriptional regulator [Aeromonas veronii]TNI07260.1 transcriptional regulator [Aeromonas veronii]HDO1311207.1 helix-turn-helix domain-containing protein [Aeromonas veronii]
MKRYLTSSSLEYVHRTKKKVRKLMAERKLSQSKISKLTEIPRSSISRWLSHHDDFMGLAEAVMLSSAMGLSVQAILADPDWSVSDDEHMGLINRAARLSKPHLASMLNCYAEILGGRVG